MAYQTIGYKRVSSYDQNSARQLDGLELDEVFEDKISGKSMERPALHSLLKHVRKGDTVVVHSMDRLARNLLDLKKIVSEIVEKGALVQFIKENLTFSGKADPFAELMLNMLGAFAEFERSLIKSRQAEGIAIRKAAGGYKGKGRKRAITDDQVTVIKARVAAGEKKTKIADDLGISRESIYKYLNA
ncbi:recombinase family protein [Geomonas anaerohicana]|uniref:Recombinase family protein n=1 Tax=Geomonas anaerohicana TaxID=2798583 RepID=A0ABS0YKP4_9BACT|nr:recombinase family protein [Geomonas anaerohicana]MBJ6752699.1 recombinase family protein [Geomonas anaerohicana]